MNLPKSKSYPTPSDEIAGLVDPFHVKASAEHTHPEVSVEPFHVEASPDTEFDGNDDGTPPIKPTHIVYSV